jgi:two-component sensor histidine kinase
MNNASGAGRTARTRSVGGRNAADGRRADGLMDRDGGGHGDGPDPGGRDPEVLLHELNHRLKNSLQSLMSYLSLRVRKAKTDSVRDALHDIRKQVIAIAVLHDEISASATLETGSMLRKIVMHLGSLAVDGDRIDLSVHGPSVPIDARLAAPFAMIAAELVWNACKHAFPRRRRGAIAVCVTRDGGSLVLSVRDNGVGMALPPSRGGGTGLAMVRKIAAQHRGRVEIGAAADAGTSVRVAFALPRAELTATGLSRRAS